MRQDFLNRRFEELDIGMSAGFPGLLKSSVAPLEYTDASNAFEVNSRTFPDGFSFAAFGNNLIPGDALTAHRLSAFQSRCNCLSFTATTITLQLRRGRR